MVLGGIDSVVDSKLLEPATIDLVPDSLCGTRPDRNIILLISRVYRERKGEREETEERERDGGHGFGG